MSGQGRNTPPPERVSAQRVAHSKRIDAVKPLNTVVDFEGAYAFKWYGAHDWLGVDRLALSRRIKSLVNDVFCWLL